MVEGTLFPCYGNTPEVEPRVGCLLLGDQLGEAGRDFTRWVVEELTAWGKSAYRKQDKYIHPHAHGRHQHGAVRVSRGRLLRAERPGAPCGAPRTGAFMALRLGVPSVTRRVPVGGADIAQGNGWGDIGTTPQVSPVLQFPNSMADPFLVMALLELHPCRRECGFSGTGPGHRAEYPETASATRLVCAQPAASVLPLGQQRGAALLHLAAAVLGKLESVPAFTGAMPFFHAEYGGQTSRSYDTSIIYGRTR